MYTIKSVSDEGIYYLVNHANDYKTYWVEKRDLRPKMLYDRAADAKASLTKLLKVMTEYKADKFYLVKINIFGIESEEELQMSKRKTLLYKDFIAYCANGVKLSKVIKMALGDAQFFQNVVYNYAKFLEMMGIYEKFIQIYSNAKSRADLDRLVTLVEKAENKEVNIDNLNIENGDLRLFCEAFDFKNNECLTESYDMWKEQFGSDFPYCIHEEIYAYIEVC